MIEYHPGLQVPVFVHVICVWPGFPVNDICICWILDCVLHNVSWIKLFENIKRKMNNLNRQFIIISKILLLNLFDKYNKQNEY